MKLPRYHEDLHTLHVNTLPNRAYYIPYSDGDAVQLPETMLMRCVLRGGELFTVPADRMECPVAEIYSRDELPAEKLGYVSYPFSAENISLECLCAERTEGCLKSGNS